MLPASVVVDLANTDRTQHAFLAVVSSLSNNLIDEENCQNVEHIIHNDYRPRSTNAGSKFMLANEVHPPCDDGSPILNEVGDEQRNHRPPWPPSK
jgi:hypothetical protein